MKRKAEKSLQAWLADKDKKHLYVTGLRGSGKTTLVLEFISRNFSDDYLYINFETSFDLRTYFENNDNTDLSDIIRGFYGQSAENLKGSCIILDELHCCKSSSNIFKKAEKMTDCRFVIIDSENVENSLSDNWYRVRMFPLTFGEFLDASGKDWYKDVIIGHFERMRSVPELVHNELNDMLSDYLITGGMPSVISRYLEENREIRRLNIEELQLKEYRNILRAMEVYTTEESSRKISLLDNVSEQIASENSYYNFSRLRKGTSYHYYEKAINSLCASGTLIRSAFKNHVRLFMPDTGLLAALLKSKVNCNEQKYSNAVIRNYIAQEIEAARDPDHSFPMEYWVSSSVSNVDHIIVDNGRKYAFKYIDESGKKIRSLNIYNEKFSVDELFAIGDVNFNIMGMVKIVPLYTVFCLFS